MLYVINLSVVSGEVNLLSITLTAYELLITWKIKNEVHEILAIKQNLEKLSSFLWKNPLKVLVYSQNNMIFR